MFLTPNELTNNIYGHIISNITQDDPQILEQAIAAAIDEMKSYLGAYNTKLIFSAEGTTATFAHCYGKISNPNVDYGGQMGYSSSIGGFAVVYVPSSSSSTLALNLEESRGDVKRMSSFVAVEKAVLDSGVRVK